MKWIGFFELLKKTNRAKLIILTYHGVIPDKIHQENPHRVFEFRNFANESDFDHQMYYIRKNFNPVSLADYLDCRMNERPLPVNSVIVTFDDGFRNNYEFAVPILKKYDMSAAFYVTTNFVGKQKMLWSEEIMYRVMHTEKKEMILNLDYEHNFSLDTIAKKEYAGTLLRIYLKKSKKQDVLNLLKNLRDKLDDVEIELEGTNQIRYGFLTWDDVRKMSEEGMEIGSHTHNHYTLNQLDLDECREELETSQRLIEEHTQNKCVLFSYPNGKKENFACRDKELLEELGYRNAVTQLDFINKGNEDPFELGRINITSGVKGIVFESYLSGIIPALRKLRKQ